MPITDSYATLAASIERTVRAELRSDPGQRHPSLGMAASIEQALLAEARAGELTLAYLRVGVAAASTVVAAWTLVAPAHAGMPAHPVAGLWARAAWTVAATLFMLALRRGWYRRWLRYGAPTADALVIGVTFVLLWPRALAGGDAFSPAALGYAAVLCAYLAAGGGLRLSRSSARLGSVLAVVVFLAAAWTARLPVVPSLAAAATLAALGSLGGRVTALVRRVVTDQVARVELSRMYEEARQAIDAREEVLKIVSHDLRNPLSTVSMSAQLMLETPLPEPMRVRQLTVIQRSVERMNRLIQDLLEVATLEAGRLGVDIRPLDIGALLEEAEETLRPLTTDKALRFETRADEGLPPCEADHGRVLQVIGNLVGNAIKFTPTGGRVTVRAEAAGPQVRFSVADTGHGIAADHLPHVFGRMWQADHRDRRGIGLGLAIAKGIVEAHGGRIWVESRLGEGTTFYFTLGGAKEGW